MLAVYCGFNASGGCLNPCITLMFCLTGKIQWKRYPVYVISQFIGGFLGACLVYGVYLDMLNLYDGGLRQVYGINATAHIFASFPRDGVSKTTGFFDISVGCGLLTGTTCMLIDPNNAKTTSGLIPLCLVFLVYGIVMSFGVNTGAPINFAVDFSGRLLAFFVGYGSDVFTRANYWFWVPPVACYCGTLVFVTTYQLMVGNHLPMEGAKDIVKFDHNAVMKTDEIKLRGNTCFSLYNLSNGDNFNSNILSSLDTLNTEVESNENSEKL